MMDARDKLLGPAVGQAPGRPALRHAQAEAVTLASIVEKETGRGLRAAARRPRSTSTGCARGMRLESDPTLIYGINRGPCRWAGACRPRAGPAATPYNTYLIAGLPPTPIANPGRASLAAVLDPPKTDEPVLRRRRHGRPRLRRHLRAAPEANVARWRAARALRAQVHRRRRRPATLRPTSMTGGR